jgi:hypothetical protein
VKRISTILGTSLAIWAGFAAVAAAATLGLASTTLGAGNAAVTPCGVTSLTATRNVDNSGNVTQVVVSGIPQSCSGQTLAVTLRNQTGGSLGSASTVVGTCTGGCSATLTGFGGTVAATSLYGYAFGLTG